MGVYAGIISTIISAGVKLYGASQSPDYPSTPKLNKLPVQQAKGQMENYESRRMQASIDAWKTRFPLLYQGGKYEIDDITRNQQGMLSDSTTKSIENAGLSLPKQGDQYGLSTDLGLSPITLAQRNSQAATRQIALNPEWTNQISGGTLATMVANNYQNQNAFTQFLGAQNTAKYVAGQQQSMYNTAALTAGLVGVAQAGSQAYVNSQNPLNRPLDPTAYKSDVSNPGYMVQPQQQPTGYGQQAQTSPYYNPNAYSSSYGNSYNWMQPAPTNYVTAPPPY